MNAFTAIGDWFANALAWVLGRSETPPRIPIGTWFEQGIDALRERGGAFFDLVGGFIAWVVDLLAALFHQPPATALAVGGAAVIAAAMLRTRRRAALITAAAVVALFVLEALTGVLNTLISTGGIPSFFFLWAMALFQVDFVFPPLIIALLALAAFAVLAALPGGGRRPRVVAACAVAAVLLAYGLVWLVGVPVPLLVTALFAVLAWRVAGWRLALFTVLGFLLIIAMNMWAGAMDSLALVLVASTIAVVIAVPIGIAAAYNDGVSRVVRPVLDLMQTMPAFVYLIPAVSFFSIGAVPGVIATIIFAMPPGVRLTELGIRQVDPELVEAGEAFGAPPGQILARIQFPLALSTVMAGVNQVIMLSLSMVVIAGMVGAGGLGSDVYEGVTRLQLPQGFEGGVAVVILAIFLDRLTAAVSRRSATTAARQGAEA
ncbi:ABC transporter permease [Allonocardiopsis opalescens]|uniref:Glycine betaine/proline transport system permease protein n=1 Tax=Allonocardiopsis opalescens TaxID=1144618 RepID=A0A2T0PTJ7_9ACTN|nr:ABC transporter permease subunit [Allonocardiopsis opalescens]PRX92118.1 glycine betaine/proline transport system permease protein [Allonocardiopsis opalescens]